MKSGHFLRNAAPMAAGEMPKDTKRLKIPLKFAKKLYFLRVFHYNAVIPKEWRIFLMRKILKRINLFLFFVLVVLVVVSPLSDILFPALTRLIHPAETSLGWNLILVNGEHYIPRDYQVNLTELANGQKVDSRIYPELQAMFDEARRQGLGLYVASGYRTTEKQRELLEEKIAEYQAQGNTFKEAQALAERWVAVPGTSEHELGISVDINADTDVCTREALYSWLGENAHHYGFIHRYPADKTEITGVINEPWHYRYVGKEAAQEMYDLGVCLEEYIESLK